MIFEPASMQYAYEQHYNSNKEEWEDCDYTFFSDMALYFNFNDEDKSIQEVSKYVDSMLKTYCKGKKKPYSIMVDSINYLGWVFHQYNVYEKARKWLFDKYTSLMYVEYSNWISEDDLVWVYRELN